MKLKTQERIRAIELSAYLGTAIASIILANSSNLEQVKEIAQFLEENNIDLNEIRSHLSNIYTLDYISSFRTQTLTTEYKELKRLYNEIIQNTCEFYQGLGAIDPISIFATYVYMYRSGYFSYDKQFLYSTDMKDFAKMSGLDVIRGRGVCRSISGMLTDIYKVKGMSSYNLQVNVSKETLRNIKELSSVNLEAEKRADKFVKLVEITTKYIPLSNHLITMVEQDDHNYIFDPTNDGFLHYDGKNYLNLANNPIYSMNNHSFGVSSVIINILGQYSDGINLKQQRKQINLPTVSYVEYEQKYLEALKICLENQALFELFHQKNKPLIENVYTISKEQNCLIRRLIPIIPNRK